MTFDRTPSRRSTCWPAASHPSRLDTLCCATILRFNHVSLSGVQPTSDQHGPQSGRHQSTSWAETSRNLAENTKTHAERNTRLDELVLGSWSNLAVRAVRHAARGTSTARQHFPRSGGSDRRLECCTPGAQDPQQRQGEQIPTLLWPQRGRRPRRNMGVWRPCIFKRKASTGARPHPAATKATTRSVGRLQRPL